MKETILVVLGAFLLLGCGDDVVIQTGGSESVDEESGDPFGPVFAGGGSPSVETDTTSSEGTGTGAVEGTTDPEQDLGECGDGLDNDNDGAADCGDSGCAWGTECAPGGQLAPEGSSSGECFDQIDNDQDGAVDCDDSDCSGFAECTSTAGDDYEGDGAGECSDGADNDQDGEFDCNDDGCAGAPNCAEGETPAEIEGDSPGECTDGIDNDGDQAVDCDDAGCSGAIQCAGSGSSGGEETGGETGGDDEEGGEGSETTPENTPATCSDGVDNDGDGDVDCDDVECSNTAGCAPPEGPVDEVSCEPTAVLSCGQEVDGNTETDGWDNILQYDCPNSEYSTSMKNTWNEWGPEVAYSFVTSQEKLVTADLTIPGFHQLDVWVLEGECNSNACVSTPISVPDEATWLAAPGVTYYIVVDGFSEWEGPYSLEIICE